MFKRWIKEPLLHPSLVPARLSRSREAPRHARSGRAGAARAARRRPFARRVHARRRDPPRTRLRRRLDPRDRRPVRAAVHVVAGGAGAGAWHGPIASGYGVHLVFIGRLPPLDEIRDQVARDWSNAHRLETTEQFYADMLKRYEIVVEWPADATPKELARGDDP